MDSNLLLPPPTIREIATARRSTQMVNWAVFAFASALILTFVLHRGSMSPWTTHAASWVGGCGMLIAGVALVWDVLGLGEFGPLARSTKVEQVFDATEAGRCYLQQLEAQGRQPVRGELRVARKLARQAMFARLKNTFLKAVLKT
jgi:hypothetical protein